MRPAKASPFGSNGDDRRQWRKQGGAVGAAASRMRAAAKQTLGAATRAVSPKVTERASPAGKSRRRSDRQALCQSDTIALPEQFGSSLALSVSSPCSSPAPPEGEPLACRSGPPPYNLSVCFADSSPSRGASGETVHFAGTAKASPR